MSQSPAIRTKDAVNPRSTRQLLDELDDLMNQMLSLPVEDEPAAAPKAVAPIAPAPALSATLTMIEPDETEPTIRSSRSTPLSGFPIHRPSPESIDAEDAPIDVSADMLVEDPRGSFAPFRRESRPVPHTSASWLVRTLVLWDRGFRRLTRRLGPLGWLVRSSVGRATLGVCGLACWIVALVWLVKDWMQ